MKKILLTLTTCAISFAVWSQETTVTTTTTTTTEAPVLLSKKGEPYLPVADEWAIGVSASTFLDYIGNFFGDGSNVSPKFEYANNPKERVAIFGKLMKDANTAYRVRFNLTINSRTNKEIIDADELAPDPNFPAYAEDWQRVNTKGIVIAPGYEKRRGSTRLQGVYGGELVLGLNTRKVSYEYGNPMTADFTSPETTNFGGNLPNSPATDLRVTETKTGANFLVGARGFVGVEYFILPKISLGGEFGYFLGFENEGKTTSTIETWDATTLSTREIKEDTEGGISEFGVGIDNLNASINLLFYF